jgi:hypothetical protein
MSAVSFASVNGELPSDILLTSHEEEVESAAQKELVKGDEQAEMTEAADAPAPELPSQSAFADAENPAVRARQCLQRLQHLPDARANQQVQPIRSLDEQTLCRREVASPAVFTKRSSALSRSTVLYR